MSDQKFTVGDLQYHLKNLNPDDELEFEGGLTFNRIKRRGDDLQVLEFSEAQAYLNEKFRKKNPHIQVAFVRDEGFAEGEVVREVDVSIR
ncbi:MULTISPECIES: hypothetical protein [Pseudomonas]|uniref:hypothetical protein n=1 Tax=Pseudomonas TaxID=286 RepID=UPI0010C0296A|nr:hypothetical protein [Pseudomonas sp. CFBP13528]TKK29524.1 hypothetical protein PspCFBP13528_17480 [Pseudomonas sp. CFBP13528]